MCLRSLRYSFLDLGASKPSRGEHNPDDPCVIILNLSTHAEGPNDCKFCRKAYAHLHASLKGLPAVPGGYFERMSPMSLIAISLLISREVDAGRLMVGDLLTSPEQVCAHECKHLYVVKDRVRIFLKWEIASIQREYSNTAQPHGDPACLRHTFRFVNEASICSPTSDSSKKLLPVHSVTWNTAL